MAIVAVLDFLPRVKCPQCGVTNRIAAHPLHQRPICGVCKAKLPDPLRSFGEDLYFSDSRLETNRLPFQILPIDKSTPARLEAYCRFIQNSAAPSRHPRTLDISRLWKILTLGPSRCSVGSDLWAGYIVFEFPHTPKAVLDCPWEGNAIYVLPQSWPKLIQQSRRHIRTHTTGWRRIIHHGDWLSRLSAALHT